MTTVPRIIAAAMELFGTQGFEETSIRQIADRCGLTDAAVLYHFRSKRQILAAVWRDAFRGGPSDQFEPAGTLAEHVDRIVAMALAGMAMRDAETRLMVRQTLAGDIEAVELRAARLEAWGSSLESLFEQTYPAEQAERMADALTMLLTGCMLRSQIEYGRAFADHCRDGEYQRHVQQLARTILRPLPEAV